jgi:hypothetical protein
MLRRRAVTGMALAIALTGAPVAARAATATLADEVAQAASGYCIEVLSGRTADPAPGSMTFRFHGLDEGVPPEAMAALGRNGANLIARATLASGKARDGAFIVALGGALGPTCRLIVWREASPGAIAAQLSQRLASSGWRALPDGAPSRAVRRQSYLRRDRANRPYLANILVPDAGTASIPLVMVVAAVPATVTLPQGY